MFTLYQTLYKMISIYKESIYKIQFCSPHQASQQTCRSDVDWRLPRGQPAGEPVRPKDSPVQAGEPERQIDSLVQVGEPVRKIDSPVQVGASQSGK